MPAVAYIQANTNGILHPADQAVISPLNRGFLYGDAIYEVWRTYDGVIFAWDEHWARLKRSAAALYLTLPSTAAEMLNQVQKTTGVYRQHTGYRGELYVRLQISRGTGPIGLDPALADRAEYSILVQPCPQLSEAQLERGQMLSVVHGLRRNPVEALNPAWKTGNYLNNLLCLREAKSRGADEAIILNLAGEITEASVCNLAFVRGDEIITPPLSAGILAGITRGLVLTNVAADAGLIIREQTIRPEALAELEEAFLLSSTKDIQPVGSIDGLRFRTGANTVTRQLKASFARYAQAQAAHWRETRQA